MAFNISPFNRSKEPSPSSEPQESSAASSLCSFSLFNGIHERWTNPLTSLKDRLVCMLPFNFSYPFFSSNSQPDEVLSSTEFSWQKVHQFKNLPSHEKTVDGYETKVKTIFPEIGASFEIQLDENFDGITGLGTPSETPYFYDEKKALQQMIKDLNRHAKISCLGNDLSSIAREDLKEQLKIIFLELEEVNYLRLVTGLNHGIFSPARTLTEAIFNRKFLIPGETMDLFSHIDLESSFAAHGFSCASSGKEQPGILGIQNWEDSLQNFELEVLKIEQQLVIIAKKQMQLKAPWNSYAFEYSIRVNIFSGRSDVVFVRLT